MYYVYYFSECFNTVKQNLTKLPDRKEISQLHKKIRLTLRIRLLKTECSGSTFHF